PCLRPVERFADRISSSSTPRGPQSPRLAIGCRRWPNQKELTSFACLKRCSGTRRKRRGSSTSAAARSTARLTSIISSPKRSQERVARQTATLSSAGLQACYDGGPEGPHYVTYSTQSGLGPVSPVQNSASPVAPTTRLAP